MKKRILLCLLPLLLTGCSLFNGGKKNSDSDFNSRSGKEPIVTDSSVKPGSTPISTNTSTSSDPGKDDPKTSYYHEVTDSDFLKVFDSKKRILEIL